MSSSQAAKPLSPFEKEQLPRFLAAKPKGPRAQSSPTPSILSWHTRFDVRLQPGTAARQICVGIVQSSAAE